MRRISASSQKPSELRPEVTQAGVATSPSDIGIDLGYHRETLIAARLIRRRYTIPDFLEETGCLETAVDHVFSRSGRWG